MFKDAYGNKISLGGYEVDETTYQYGLLNICSTTGQVPSNTRCKSSLEYIPNNDNYNILLLNPPFGKDFKVKDILTQFKQLKTNKINTEEFDKIYSIQKDNAPVLFLQLAIHKLEDNGLCMIVLPYGELFFGSSFKNVREDFLKNINIFNIILFPSGVFTHTGIKTV